MEPGWFRQALPYVILLMLAGGFGSGIWAAVERKAERERHRAAARLETAKKSPKPGLNTAKTPLVPPVPAYVFDIDLSRTPIFSARDERYAVLGLGQDGATGRQTVWIRSIQTNRIAAFKQGDRLFGGPVRLLTIRPAAVSFAYAGKTQVVALP